MSVRSNVRKSSSKDIVKPEPIPVISLPNSNNINTQFVYYESQYINDTPNVIPAAFTDSRTDAIVENLSEYKMAVTKLSLGASTIPMFTIGVGGNKGFGGVGMYYRPDNLDFSFEAFIIAPPRFPIYEISYFLDNPDYLGGLNPTMARCFDVIKNQYDAIHGPGSWAANPLLPQQPPAFVYDPTTGLFTLYTPPQNLDSDPNHIDLFLSSDISSLFSGFSFYSPPYSTPFDHPFDNMKWDRIAIFSSFNQPTVTIGGNSYLAITQNYSSVPKWYTFNKIVVVSESLGVRNSNIGFIKASTTSSSDNTQFATIVDFSTNLDNSIANNPATNITYIPQNIRWIDCLSTSPLKRVSLSVNLLDDAGDIVPVTIVPGSSLSVTLTFAKIVF